MPASALVSSSSVMHRAALAAALALAAGAALEAQRIRVTESLEALEATARRDSNDATALYNLSVGYMSRNRWDEADSLLRRAVAIDPQFAVGFFGLSLVQDRNDRHWDQLKRAGGDSAVMRERRLRVGYARKAFLVDPFVDIRLIGVIVRRGRAPNVFVQAINAIMDGNYQNAYGLLNLGYQYNVTAAGPDSLPPDVLWLHALAAARTQQWVPAISDVQALIRLSEARERSDSLQYIPLRTHELRYMLGALYQRASQNTRAIQQFERALADDIGNYMAHVQLARISDAERDWFNAVRRRRLAVEINPEDHTLYYDLGNTLLFTGRFAEAEEALLQARAMQPRYVPLWLALGIAQKALGKNAEAREAFTHYLAIAPERYENGIREAREHLSQLP